MLQSLKQIKNRIRSVENTKKVTAAMQMISLSKLNRIKGELFALRPYALKLENLMHGLVGLSPGHLSDYFKKNTDQGDIVLCLITSDSGLCGTYNQNVIRTAEEFIKDNGVAKVKLILVGQKALSYFRAKPVKIIDAYLGLNAKFSQNFCAKITSQLIRLFLSKEAASVYLAYASFGNSIIQRVTIEQLLSIKPKIIKPVDYIIEPDLQSILEDLIPHFLMVKIHLVLLEAFTSEHASRTISMKTATDNAKELLEGLLLMRNKVRQAGITQSILEITSSAEALKG